jgi:Ca2+-binding EF-hand superfamily protein
LNKREQLEHAAHQLFEKFDLDGNTVLDVQELNEGLDEVGYRLSQRQLRAFKKNV